MIDDSRLLGQLNKGLWSSCAGTLDVNEVCIIGQHGVGAALFLLQIFGTRSFLLVRLGFMRYGALPLFRSRSERITRDLSVSIGWGESAFRTSFDGCRLESLLVLLEGCTFFLGDTESALLIHGDRLILEGRAERNRWLLPLILIISLQLSVGVFLLDDLLQLQKIILIFQILELIVQTIDLFFFFLLCPLHLLHEVLKLHRHLLGLLPTIPSLLFAFRLLLFHIF